MNVSSSDYVDQLYRQFLDDPSQLAQEWQDYFRHLQLSSSAASAIAPVVPSGPSSNGDTISNEMSVAQLQDRVDQLVRGFRVRGHLEAKIDPLGIPRPTNRELNPASYALLPPDMEKQFSARTINGDNFRTLREIVETLRTTYCRSIGAQFMHIDDHRVRDWLQKRMEGSENHIQLSHDTQIRILTRLTDAVIIEEFVRRKFVGAKTFSLEGAETLIPLLDQALEKAGEHRVVEVVLGMAHRGRLNVLANLFSKRAQNIFWSFDDPRPEEHRGAGDVLYHMGHSTDWTTSTGCNMHLSLCFNPSHLEFVDPVAVGRCRSKQDRISDTGHERVMTVLIHGDAAFAGEGIVQETFNLSQLPGYRVGGTLHVIVNNQIGFTTPAVEGRSTTYASDIAKMLQIPIFHVNGEDPEAVAQVVDVSMEFRRKFQRDVVIDMYCFRRLGHNESDEPRFTQPVMYKTIDSHETIRDSYLKRLLKMGGITQDEADEIAQRRKLELDIEFESAKNEQYKSDSESLGGYWRGYYGGPERSNDDFDTGVSTGMLSFVIEKMAEVPDSFHLHRKLERMMQQRREMASGKRPVDWATAELAAMGTLAVDGHSVRLSGQDSGRGTFSQRHAVLYDSQNGHPYVPLKHMSGDQAPVDVINSPLSEAGVLGFEYGYSLDRPESLVMWEAQFGDFWNAAQVIVDQFITSAEDKWNRLSGLTMLLPHGFEGAGPEHCTARLERFLTLTAEHNIQIVIPTSAAQYFHVLRRQVKRPWRKPLVILTPKSLLREPMVMSHMDDMIRGCFQRVLNDPNSEIKRPAKIILAAGKIAVELLKQREERQTDNVAIIRMEQLYPVPREQLQQALQNYPDGTPVYWVQEEPKNMGAYAFMRVNFDNTFFGRWPFVGAITRPESASPSTGSKKTHKMEQSELLDAAMATENSVVSST